MCGGVKLTKQIKTPSLKEIALNKNTIIDNLSQDGSEYGFFEDIEVDHSPMHFKSRGSFDTATTTAADSSNCSRSMSQETEDDHYLSSPESTDSMCFSPDASHKKEIHPEDEIICSLTDEQAPISCRSFPNGLVAQVSLCGFRLMKNRFHEYAEYKIVLKLNDYTVSAWKRMDDFHHLATAYFDLAMKLNRTSNCEGAPFRMQGSIHSWNGVLRNEENLRQGNGYTSQYLVSETTLLKVFVKYLLFEMPAIEIFVDFMEE